MIEQAITDTALFLDLYTPFDIMESERFSRFHQRLMERTPERDAMPVPELKASEATRERVLEMCKDYTFPLVIRGGLADAESVARWSDPEFWLPKYAKEKILCSSAESTGMYNVEDFFNANKGLYVAGAASIFERNPELRDMVNNDLTRLIAPDHPGKAPRYTQLFMGWQSQGTTVHCALGLNLFRQIAGRKKWYFMAPEQSPWVYPKMYANGYSCTSKTVQSTKKGSGTDWFRRVDRYTVTVEPGDLLVNPAWWWHSVENVGDPDELVIGIPTRFDSMRRAFKVDPFKSAISTLKFASTRSPFRPGMDPVRAAEVFEESLIRNRNETYQQLVLKS